VLSVSTTGDPPGARTSVEVADDSLVPATESADVLFGALDVSVADRRVVGVDAVVVLGTDYLALLQSGAPVPTGSSVPTPATTAPASAPVTETTND
jgi:hypothetical protein